MLFQRSCGEISSPKLVFLHGFLGDHADWKVYQDALSDGFYTIAIDLPGHGKSPVMSKQDFLKALPKPAHYVGYSMGGRILLDLLQSDPKSVLSATCISTNPGLETAEEINARIEWESLIQSKLQTLALSDFLAFWYQLPLFKNFFFPESRMQQDPQKLTLAFQEFSIVKTKSFWDNASSLTRPLWIVGELDKKYVDIAKRLEKQAADVCIIPGASHPVHLQQKRACIKKLIKHLEASCKLHSQSQAFLGN